VSDFMVDQGACFENDESEIPVGSRKGPGGRKPLKTSW